MATVNNIVVNASSPMGGELKQLSSLLWAAQGLAMKLLLQMQSQTDLSTYATLETAFGLTAGQGSNAYALLFAVANGNPASPSGFGAGAFSQFMGRIN